MKRSKRRIKEMKRYILFILICSAQLVLGQRQLMLTGVIQDENNTPIPFANAALFTEKDSSMVGGAVSDDYGKFSLNVKPGSYFLRVTFLSYTEQKIAGISVSNSDVDVGKVIMRQGAKMLTEVEVAGQRSQMELQLDKRVFQVGQDLSNAGGNAADVLSNIPSVTVDADGTVSLRGSENVRILIDGKPSGLTSRDPDALRQIQSNLVQRVEVITNPSSRYDAAGEVGIINIILKKNKQAGLNGTFVANAGYPAFYGGSYTINLRRKKINLFSSYGVDYRESPGWSRSYQQFTGTDTSFVYRENGERNSSSTSHNLSGGLDYFLNDKNTITGAIQYNIEHGFNKTLLTYRDYQNDILTKTTTRQDREAEDETNVEASLNYKKEFNIKGREFVTDFKYIKSVDAESSDYLQVASDGDQLIQRADNTALEKNWLVQSDYIHPIGSNGKFETGLKTSTRIVNNEYELEELNDEGEWTVFPAFNNNMVYTERIHALYLMGGNKYNKVSMQAGVRGEYSDIETELTETNEGNTQEYFNIFPSANVGYEVKKDRTLQLSYSYRINRPSFRDLLPFSEFSDSRSFFVGNPNLRPEYTHSFEGSFLMDWESASFFSSLYYRARQGVIQRISEIDEDGINRTVPVNMATQDAFGLEINFSLEPVKGMQINSGSNFFRAITEGAYNEESLYSDTYAFNSRTSSKITLFKSVTFQAAYQYNSPRITTQGRQRSSYSVDLGLAKDVLKGKATITANVRDLFNSRVRSMVVDLDNYYSSSTALRRVRQFRISFTYRLNSVKERERGDERIEEGPED
jgi:outer membrane receptor protein involved in Fe transport